MRTWIFIGLVALSQLLDSSNGRLQGLRPPAVASPTRLRIPPGPGVPVQNSGNLRGPPVADDVNVTPTDGDALTTEPPVTSSPVSYYITFAYTVRAGVNLPVSVRLLNAGNVSTVSVSLTMTKSDANASITVLEAPPVTIIADGSSHIINLEIPHHLEPPHYRKNNIVSYYLHVVGEGDVNFNESTSIDVARRSFSVFVQTDKAVYKPGQTVKFRALAMSPNMSVLTEPVNIFIMDSNGNGIKRWKNVQGFTNTGVIERSLPLSMFAVQGDWHIDVTVLGQKETKVFTVQEYVLPKFEAMVKVPKVALSSAPALRGKAKASYTFGKPLVGAQVLVTLKNVYFYGHYNNKTEPTLTQSGVLDSNGELEFAFHKEDMLGVVHHSKSNLADLTLDWRSLQVLVNVTDARTGDTMGADAIVNFREDEALITFPPISPTSFKPGLKFTTHVKVTKMDESLFELYNNINVTFNVTINVPVSTTTTTTTTTTTKTFAETNTSYSSDILIIDKIKPFPRYRTYPSVNTVVLTTFNKTLTANGFLSVELDIPPIAQSVQVQVIAMGVKRYHVARQAMSPSDSFLQIHLRTDNPKDGQSASFDIKTTEAVDTVIYQVYSKGVMLNESTATVVDADRQRFNGTFFVTPNMAPICRVLAFYIRPTGEVVADSLSFKVDSSSEHQVKLSYNRPTVKPGEDVELTVTARPNSVVFVLCADKSLQLLKTGNDITKDMLDAELVKYQYGSGGGIQWRYMSMCGWPSRFGGVDAFGVFSDANVKFLPEVLLDQEPYSKRRQGLPTRTQEMSIPTDMDEDDRVDQVRTFFPETWLFLAIVVGDNGQAVVHKTAPDTITTWLTSAFSVHPVYGLSVIQKPAELTTFKSLFVSLDLPYSAIRGEDLCMKVLAFNYHEKMLYVSLVMGRSEGISNIRLIRTSRKSKNRVEYRAPMRVSHRIGKVKSNEVGETSFCFTPNSLGHMPIRVNLTTTSRLGDGVVRMLLVEPEGVPRTQNLPLVLDIDGGSNFEEVVPVMFPGDAVSGSQRIRVSLAGDLLGSVFDNIDDLLQMPYGCGEQNMLYFAPNVFLIDYLQKTSTYTEELAKTAENYMLVGYQKEITYQHQDGSYSAFGEERTNGSGSMWLTAFVTKCFAQSMALEGDVIAITPMLVTKSLTWMVSKQLKNGSFPEPGKVFNKNMQGGSAKGEALTAYVVIALAEAEANFEDIDMYNLKTVQAAISHGRAYLEKQLVSLNDSYDLAIVTYALHLTNSDLATQAFERLQAQAITESLLVHWERPKPDAPPRYYYWQRQTDAINIEMTAYALLTYIKRDDVTGALPIVRWLTNQRGAKGGFISTQDTVVGLQALAQIATVIYQPTFTPITMTVAWSVGGQQETRTLTLDETNRRLLQKVVVPTELNQIPADITIRASVPAGMNVTGMAVAEVTLDYNVLEPTTFTTYSVTPNVKVINDNNFMLGLSASRVDGKSGSMTVIEVGVPTSYQVNMNDPMFNVMGSSRVEVDDRKIILYYDELDATPVSATLPMKVTNGIPVNTQPTPVKIYDYYESGGEQQMTVNYELPKVGFICDRQPEYETCRYIKR